MNVLRCRFRRLRAKLNLKGVVRYSLQRSLLTDANEPGLPITEITDLGRMDRM